MSDYIIPDEHLLHDILEITDDEMNENMYTYQILEQLNIPLERYNEDEGRTNPYGMKLLDLCRRCSLFIAIVDYIMINIIIGHTTCKDISTVDYLIMYPFLFQYVNEFTVCDFNPMFSDVHNRIHFTIAAKVETRENHAKVDHDRKYVKWNQAKSQNFVNDLFSDENSWVKNFE